MNSTDRRERLASARASLRSTWPSLTAADVEDFPPNSHEEAFALLKQRTGATDDEIATTLSEVFGLQPEKHDPAAPQRPGEDDV